VPEEEYKKVEYKFSFAIVRSLMGLSGYGGITYRGVGFRDRLAKAGSIVCFKSFTSSSLIAAKAKLFGRTTFYTIHSVTGR
jgi:hypothetical protein